MQCPLLKVWRKTTKKVQIFTAQSPLPQRQLKLIDDSVASMQELERTNLYNSEKKSGGGKYVYRHLLRQH